MRNYKNRDLIVPQSPSDIRYSCCLHYECKRGQILYKNNDRKRFVCVCIQAREKWENKIYYFVEKYECLSSIKNWNVECNRIKEGGRKRTTHEAYEYRT